MPIPTNNWNVCIGLLCTRKPKSSICGVLPLGKLPMYHAGGHKTIYGLGYLMYIHRTGRQDIEQNHDYKKGALYAQSVAMTYLTNLRIFCHNSVTVL